MRGEKEGRVGEREDEGEGERSRIGCEEEERVKEGEKGQR